MKKIFTFFAAIVCAMSMSALTYNVTVPTGTNACYIAGEMNGWSQQEMTKVDDTHYTLELADATEAMKYKYCSGPGWEYVECGADDSEIADRTYTENDVVAKWRSVYTPEGGNEGEDPNIEPGFTGFFTRSDVSGNKLTLRLTINQIIGAQGTCRLLMTNDNGGQIEQVAQTVSNPSSSSCQGFDVPLDGAAKGNWNVRVTVEADGKTGILETVVKI